MNTCLTCLLETKRKMYAIEETDTDLINKIEECGGFKIMKDENFPNKICPKCYAALNVAYDFRVCCQNSQLVLRQKFQLLPELDEIEIENDDEDVFLPITATDFKDFDDIVKGEDAVDYIAVNEPEEDIEPEAGILDGEKEIAEVDFIEEYSQFYTTEEELEVKKEIKLENEKLTRKNAKSKVQLDTKSKRTKKRIIIHTEDEANSEHKRQRTRTKGPKGPFMCHHCGQMYPDKNCLNSHLKQHLPDEQKAHQCEICHRRFNNARQIQIHINTHTGQRPYKCQYCTMAFGDPSSRLRHERVHQNIRPYKCEECQKSFTYSHALKKHLRIHRGEKPHSCDYCDRRFTEAHQKKAHENTHRKHMQKDFVKYKTCLKAETDSI